VAGPVEFLVNCSLGAVDIGWCGFSHDCSGAVEDKALSSWIKLSSAGLMLYVFVLSFVWVLICVWHACVVIFGVTSSWLMASLI
jgi:hypothetical protein